MDDNYLPRQEHEEFARRQDEENKRQNRRIELLEDSVRQINDLTVSVNKMAVNMESMLREQEKQGKRLEMVEGRDGEMWRKVTGCIITTIIGIVVGYIFSQIRM